MRINAVRGWFGEAAPSKLPPFSKRRRGTPYLALLALLLLTITPHRPALHAADQVPDGAGLSQADACAQVVAVPAGECAALVELYNTTGGANWLNQAGWLAFGAGAPCDWFGIVCVGGHVVELNLSKNRLNGAFPSSLAGLPALARLALDGNHLHGVVPHGICALAGTAATADLSYNGLFSAQESTRTCLDRLDPDWAASQTTPVRRLRPAAIEGDVAQLDWTPIAYTADGGFYEVSYATAHDGPYVIHGRTADKQATGYRVDGLAAGTTYFLRVQTVTPAHAGNPTEVRGDFAQTAAVTRTSQSVLLIVYFPADNDLAPEVEAVEERLRLGTEFNPNARVVLLTDQDGVDDTWVRTITGGTITPTNAVFERWKTHELDTADAEVLSWFLRYARETYPADREIVSLMGHGLALAPEVEWPSTGQNTLGAGPQSRIPILPKGVEITPNDITDRGYMSTVDQGRALAAATDGGANPFDLLFFDQCFQGNLDTLYEVRSAAEFFIASPNYAWLTAPYDQYLAMLAPASRIEDITVAIITRYQRSLNDLHPNVILGVRRSDIEAVAVAVSALGEALARVESAEDRALIAQAADASQYIDTTQCGDQELTLGPPDQLMGAGSFALNLYNAFPPGDSYGVRAAAENVRVALAPIHKSGRIGSPYLAPDQTWDYTNSLTILAPLSSSSPAAVAWRSSVYTETVPLNATWTPAPTMTVRVTASFAFVRDGSWDEFLAGWYDRPLAPTVGDWCPYLPPAIVGDAGVEPLALEAAEAGGPALRLTWGPTTHEESPDYLLYVWRPDGVAWVAEQVVPFGQTSTVIADLVPGEDYRFMLVAQDAAGITVAQSNEVEWTARWYGAYLPFVGR